MKHLRSKAEPCTRHNRSARLLFCIAAVVARVCLTYFLICPTAVPSSSKVTRFSDVARPLLEEPLKEMLVLHGLDLNEMSYELSAEVAYAMNRAICKRFRNNMA